MYSPMNDGLYAPFPMSPIDPSCPPMEQSYSTTSQTPNQPSPLSFSFTDVYPSSGSELEIPFYSLYDMSPPSPHNSNIQELYALNTSYSVPIPSSSSSSSSYSSSFESQFTFTPNIDDSMLTYNPFGTSAPSSESSKSTKPYGCEDCGRAFTRSADLRRHQTSAHNPIYQDCPVEHCSRKKLNGFPRRDHLIEHLRSYHHLDVPKRRMTKRAPRSAA
ncbi:putative C2H2 finger domain protein [Aspergillus clavatus NRRL 1]|uniref:C2H2 finger domain protein, putative n=1 Tax=Aspergillus clavatus (strain ATCC 1007 / CBS 513.65 / DSM 816 / NCTC 3887 / NRRL 1 / QM 1276 / 107) TaxID=344612 RepID=A1CFC8_ASPCL|nr:C2H2 finger domain protein, putative [Aspergillus clavatus NRRL 1]EAW11577.1 C2H2 finger domain protein, putative [Aspergillus clavatus NRRL 1]